MRGWSLALVQVREMSGESRFLDFARSSAFADDLGPLGMTTDRARRGTAEAVPFQGRSIASRQYPKRLSPRQPIHRKIPLVEGEDCVQAVAGGEVD